MEINFSDKLVENYQEDANRLLARVCRLVALLIVLIGVLNMCGIFVIKGEGMYIIIGLSVCMAMLPTLIFDVMQKNETWARYFVLTALMLMSQTMYAVLSYHSIIMLESF